jgi:hypothetical protein
MSETVRRIEDWATRRRGLAVLAVAAAGLAVTTVVSPGEFDAVAYATVAVAVAGMYVHTVAQRERCEECDERVYPEAQYCGSCGHEVGCDHDVDPEADFCPVCGADLTAIGDLERRARDTAARRLRDGEDR